MADIAILGIRSSTSTRSGEALTASAVIAEKSAERTPLEVAALVALLGVSGCAALIYQVVWFQLLGLVLGASAVSIGILLATFMGGMGLGAGLYARCVAPRHHALRVFACLELGIAVCGLGVLFALPALRGLYTAFAGSGTLGLVWRAFVACICLLPPTLLMGATLPALARWTETTRRGVARVGFLYCSNVAGAVIGAVLAGFYLLREYDVAVATFSAVGLNVAAAAGAFVIAAKTQGAARAQSESLLDEHVRFQMARSSWPIHWVIAMSGMTALAAEVVWTRALTLLLGATVYAYALVVAVFLCGLGIGSGIGSVLVRRGAARSALGACQLLLCLALAWGAYALARVLPYWPLDVMLPAPNTVVLQLDLVRTAYAILPAALLWGASFPIALGALEARSADPARLIGRVYAANTMGAVCGAVATSLLLVPWLGSRGTQQALIVVAAVAGALALGEIMSVQQRRGVRLAAAIAGLVIAAALAYRVPELPRELVAFGRFLPTRGIGADVVYVGEGRSASVAVSDDEGTRTFHSAGKAQASTHVQDMRLQRMLGHLATLVPETGGSYLVIGLGAGVTAGAVSIDPHVERVVVAEIEPLARHAAGEYFRAENFGVVDAPRVEIRIDDGRHYLETTDATFDAITSDPLDPWVKGAAALYTREFWQLVRSRLNAGGVVTVFVQLYETTEAAVKSEIASFFAVFPNGAVFANTAQGVGYDLVLLGRAGDAPIDIDRIQRRLNSVEYERVRRSLAEVGFHSAIELFGTYVGRGADFSVWLEDARLNTDRNFRLQYLAGEGFNVYSADAIFRSMTPAEPELPADLFSGSPELLEQLRARVEAGRAHGR